MSKALIKIAVWYLRRKQVSVIMNCVTDKGRIKLLARDSYIYDNHFEGTLHYTRYGQEVKIPNCEKFEMNFPWNGVGSE